MNYLLDTHVLIWAITESDKLSLRVRETLNKPDNRIFVSLISFWEISLKFGLGKLELQGIQPETRPSLAIKTGFEIIPLLHDECSDYHMLKAFYHRDPFDRMLVWQAIKLSYTIISKDTNIALYTSEGLNVFW